MRPSRSEGRVPPDRPPRRSGACAREHDRLARSGRSNTVLDLSKLTWSHTRRSPAGPCRSAERRATACSPLARRGAARPLDAGGRRGDVDLRSTRASSGPWSTRCAATSCSIVLSLPRSIAASLPPSGRSSPRSYRVHLPVRPGRNHRAPAFQPLVRGGLSGLRRALPARIAGMLAARTRPTARCCTGRSSRGARRALPRTRAPPCSPGPSRTTTAPAHCSRQASTGSSLMIPASSRLGSAHVRRPRIAVSVLLPPLASRVACPEATGPGTPLRGTDGTDYAAPAVPDGVTIAGVPVGGLTAEDAYALRCASSSTQPLVHVRGQTKDLNTGLGSVPRPLAARSGERSQPPRTAVPLQFARQARRPRPSRRLASGLEPAPVDSRARLRCLRPGITGARVASRLRQSSARTPIRKAFAPHGARRWRSPTVSTADTGSNFGPVIVIRRGSNQLHLYRGMRLVAELRRRDRPVGVPDAARPLLDRRQVEAPVVVSA